MLQKVSDNKIFENSLTKDETREVSDRNEVLLKQYIFITLEGYSKILKNEICQ